jgi:hypothetical protein
LITKIVAQLKTGTYKNVVPYGFPLPSPPYIVVAQKRDIAGRGTAFHIFVHMAKSTTGVPPITQLEDYVRNDLSLLLSDFQTTDRHGNLNRLYQDYNQLPELVVDNDDNTISMERVFWMPDILF